MGRDAISVRTRLADGIVDGVLATATMSAVLGAGEALGAVAKQPPDLVVDATTTKVGAAPLPPPAKGPVVWAAHFAFGAAMGALFRVLRPQPRLPTLEGVVFGVAVWAANYAVLLPAARLLPPATRDDRRRQVTNVLSHAVYGLTLGVRAGK